MENKTSSIVWKIILGIIILIIVANNFDFVLHTAISWLAIIGFISIFYFWNQFKNKNENKNELEEVDNDKD